MDDGVRDEIPADGDLHPGISGEGAWSTTLEYSEEAERRFGNPMDRSVRTPVTIDLGEHGCFDGELTSLDIEDRSVDAKVIGHFRKDGRLHIEGASDGREDGGIEAEGLLRRLTKEGIDGGAADHLSEDDRIDEEG